MKQRYSYYGPFSHICSVIDDLEMQVEWLLCSLFQEDDAGSSGASSPESTGSIESSISSHFGGMNYPSLFSSHPSGYGASQQSVFSLKLH